MRLEELLKYFNYELIEILEDKRLLIRNVNDSFGVMIETTEERLIEKFNKENPKLLKMQIDNTLYELYEYQINEHLKDNYDITIDDLIGKSKLEMIGVSKLIIPHKQISLKDESKFKHKDFNIVTSVSNLQERIRKSRLRG